MKVLSTAAALALLASSAYGSGLRTEASLRTEATKEGGGKPSENIMDYFEPSEDEEENAGSDKGNGKVDHAHYDGKWRWGFVADGGPAGPIKGNDPGLAEEIRRMQSIITKPTKKDLAYLSLAAYQVAPYSNMPTGRPIPQEDQIKVMAFEAGWEGSDNVEGPIPYLTRLHGTGDIEVWERRGQWRNVDDRHFRMRDAFVSANGTKQVAVWKGTGWDNRGICVAVFTGSAEIDDFLSDINLGGDQVVHGPFDHCADYERGNISTTTGFADNYNGLKRPVDRWVANDLASNGGSLGCVEWYYTGHSLGGVMADMFALKYGHRCKQNPAYAGQVGDNCSTDSNTNSYTFGAIPWLFHSDRVDAPCVVDGYRLWHTNDPFNQFEGNHMTKTLAHANGCPNSHQIYCGDFREHGGWGGNRWCQVNEETALPLDLGGPVDGPVEWSIVSATCTAMSESGHRNRNNKYHSSTLFAGLAPDTPGVN